MRWIRPRKKVGGAAKLAERDKIENFKSFSENYEFIPFAVESMCNSGTLTKKFTNDLGKTWPLMINVEKTSLHNV